MTVIADRKVDRIIADFPILARPVSRGKRLVYLDSAATSQKPRAVIAALVDYYEQYNANIHRGVYEIAARATAQYELARVKIARFIGADVSEVVWVRNTTEAINLVAYSWGNVNVRSGDAILLTELEHHSDLVPWQLLAERTGAQLRFIPVDDRGIHILDDLDELLDGCKLVAIGHVSNTLGTIAPLDIIVPARTLPVPSYSLTVRRGRRICRSTSKRLTPIFTRSAATRCLVRPGSGCSTESARCSSRCRPSSQAAI